MKKLLFAVLLLALLAACTPGALPPDGAEISWDEAVALLHDGQVTQIFQAHTLRVVLTLRNGAQVSTMEPSIDAIFFEVQQCGASCANIALATE